MRPKEPNSYAAMREKRRGVGSISPNRRAWLTLSHTNISMYAEYTPFAQSIEKYKDVFNEYSEKYISDHGDGYSIYINVFGSNVKIALHNYTENELLAMKKFFDNVFELALPISREQDRIARELLDEYGDDSFHRLYRGVPELFVRKGTFPEYNQGLRERPEGPVVLDGRVRVNPIASASERAVAKRNAKEQLAGDHTEADGDS